MLHYPLIDPVALQLGPVKVHWYGLMYALAFACALCLGYQRCKQPSRGWELAQLQDVVFYAAIGVIVGGRIGYVLFYNFDYFLAHPLWLFRIDQGGMSFHGGFVGVTCALWIFARTTAKNFFDVTDFVAPLVPLGLAAGRVGNFIGGELWGRVTSSPLAMVFPNDPLQLPRHPSQLYQMAVEGLLLFAILWWFSAKPRPRAVVSGLFLAGYGTGRIVVEFFRQPDPQLGFLAGNWLTMGQLLSLPMVIAGVGMMVASYRRPALFNGAVTGRGSVSKRT